MITVYSKDNCTKCSQAVLVLQMKGVEHEVKKLGKDYTREEAFELAQGQREYPIVYKGDVKIGGFNDLLAYLKS